MIANFIDLKYENYSFMDRMKARFFFLFLSIVAVITFFLFMVGVIRGNFTDGVLGNRIPLMIFVISILSLFGVFKKKYQITAILFGVFASAGIIFVVFSNMTVNKFATVFSFFPVLVIFFVFFYITDYLFYYDFNFCYYIYCLL